MFPKHMLIKNKLREVNMSNPFYNNTIHFRIRNQLFNIFVDGMKRYNFCFLAFNDNLLTTNQSEIFANCLFISKAAIT